MIPKNLIEKMPPQNLEAETAVLGSMLLDREAIAVVIDHLDENSFYTEGNRKIFTAILKLYDVGKAVDIVTLIEELKKKSILDEVGGPARVAEMAGSVPTSANVEYYAKIVKEKALLRTLISTATKIVSESYDSSAEIEELLDRAEKQIFDITSGHRSGDRVSEMKEVVKESIETIDRLYQRKESVTGIPTGFHDMDIKTAGLQKSDLVILAGRPSMEKARSRYL